MVALPKRKRPHVVSVRLSTPLFEATQKYRDNREFSDLIHRLLSSFLEDQDAVKEELRQQIEEEQQEIRKRKSRLASMENQLESLIEAEKQEQAKRDAKEEAREVLRDHYDHLRETGSELRESRFWAVAEGKGFVDELGEELIGGIIEDLLAGEVRQ